MALRGAIAALSRSLVACKLEAGEPEGVKVLRERNAFPGREELQGHQEVSLTQA